MGGIDRVINEFVQEAVGEEAIPIVQILKKNTQISEVELAKEIKRDIQTTRNLLYQLHQKNLVSFGKKREGKEGWYNYYWSFNKKHVKPLISVYNKHRLDVLKRRLEREKNGNFYVCSNNCVRVEFTNAMEASFRCPECGSLLNEQDNEEHIKNIEEGMRRLSSHIKMMGG